MKAGFEMKAPLRQRLRMAWHLVKGHPVAYHIGCIGSGIYLPERAWVVGCEADPKGLFRERSA